MRQILKNVFLYFSAFVPMYVLIQVKFIVDLALGDVDSSVFTYCVLVFLLILVVLGIIGLLWNIKWNKDESENVTLESSTNITDQHFLGYLSIFILFALSFDLTKISMFCIFLAILIFVGIVYVNNKLFYINPFLNILGFNFYEITYIKDDDTQSKTAKMFYRGDLQTADKRQRIKLKNDHFSFIERNK